MHRHLLMHRLLLAALVPALLLSLSPSASAQGFSDIAASDPDAAAIAFVASEGVMTGVGEAFEPDRPVTRAEMAKIALLDNELPVPPMDQAPFGDVPLTHSLAPYVSALARSDGGEPLLRGYPDGMFRPDRSITIAEASKVLLGAAVYNPQDHKSYFDTPDFDSLYNVAAQQNIFDRPIDFYLREKDAPAKRREIARAVARMQRWRDLATQPDLFTCKPADAWPELVRRNMLWSVNGAYSDICVSDALGVGYVLVQYPTHPSMYLYVFRADDRLEVPSQDGEGMIGGINVAQHDLYSCTLAGREGLRVLFSCVGRQDEVEVASLDLQTWARTSEPGRWNTQQ